MGVSNAEKDSALTASGATSTAVSGALEHVGKYRWTICALLFFATTINYIDRQVIGILGPTLQRDLGWNEQQFADVVSWFTIAYAIGFLFAGRIMDRFGTRRGFAGSVTIWSLSAMGMALARTASGFSIARFLLGLGESGNFPASIKTVAEWFPSRERALATGVFNAGSNVGAIITPILVPWIALNWGWRPAFIATGALGFLWLIPWLMIYRPPREHPKCGAAELAHITSDPVDPVTAVPWMTVLRKRQTWAFALGKFMTDPVWWLYLFWIPDFFSRTHNLSLTELGPPIVTIYLIADIGSVGGGWLSSSLIKRGWSVNASRKTAMLVCALAVVPIVFAPRVHSVWGAVALIGLAAAAHQGWSANLFTLPSDMFARPAVGSVVGIGGTAGAIGGMLIAKLTGGILQVTGSYVPVFVIAGVAYLAALAVIQALAPRLRRVA